MKDNFERYAAFIKHLPVHANDEALIALKGHLLVEIALREYICLRVPHPERIRNKQINFASLVDFASSLENENKISWIWKALRDLNSIRNALAHNLEPEGFKAKEKDFITYIKNNNGDLSITADNTALKYGPMPIAIFQVFDALLTSPDPSHKIGQRSAVLEELSKAMAQLDKTATHNKRL